MKPTVGRIVHFRLTQEQARKIALTRLAGEGFGNMPQPGDVLPLVVTAVWPEEYRGSPNARLAEHPEGTAYESPMGVNGQVLLDGNDSLWVTSAPQHSTLPGCWFWPPREP